MGARRYGISLPQYYWNHFYLKATAVIVKAEDKSNSGPPDSSKQYSNTFINTIENFFTIILFSFYYDYSLLLYLFVFISKQVTVRTFLLQINLAT